MSKCAGIVLVGIVAFCQLITHCIDLMIDFILFPGHSPLAVCFTLCCLYFLQWVYVYCYVMYSTVFVTVNIMSSILKSISSVLFFTYLYMDMIYFDTLFLKKNRVIHY